MKDFFKIAFVLLKDKFWREYWNFAIFQIDSFENFLKNPEKFAEKAFFPFDKKGFKRPFFADPFIVKKDGEAFVFFESISEGEKNGKIEAVSIGQDFKGDFLVLEKFKDVLRKNYHLSYPMVFKEGKEFFMIPETFQNKEIALYKSLDFPVNWVKIKTLIPHIEAVDATIFKKDGLFWIFCFGLKNNEKGLRAFYSESLTGNWQPHKKNPIKVGDFGVRSAGPIFEKNGRWFRPSQDNRNSYGESLILQEIKQLDVDNFEEKIAGKLSSFLPDYPSGLHHLSFCENYLVVDFKKNGFLKSKFSHLVGKIKHLLKKRDIIKPNEKK